MCLQVPEYERCRSPVRGSTSIWSWSSSWAHRSSAMRVGSDASPGLGLASPGCQCNTWPDDHLPAFRPQCCCLSLGCFAWRYPCNSPALLSSCIYQVLSSCGPCQHLVASKSGAQLCQEPSVQDQTCLQITAAGWLDRDGVLRTGWTEMVFWAAQHKWGAGVDVLVLVVLQGVLCPP